MPKKAARPLAADIADAAWVIASRLSGANHPSVEPSAAVSDLIYRGTRYWGLAQIRSARLAKKTPRPEVLALLAIAWAAIDQELRAIHVVVDEAVAAAKIIAQKLPGKNNAQALAGFVNAFLRKTLADTDTAQADFLAPVARWNAPAWWIEKILSDHGNFGHQMLDALVTRAPMTVRLCDRKIPTPQYLELLAQSGYRAHLVGPRAIVIEPAVPVQKIPGFSEGWVSVQDSAAQHVSDIFLPLSQRLGRPPLILDACAAPGGKTFAMIQTMACSIWSLDSSAARMARMQRDWERVRPYALGPVQMRVLDVMDPHAWRNQGLPESFDGILLDAPCTASGVTRRHPEIAWRRQASDVAVVADIQRRLLDTLWAKLALGGELAFVTCSVFAAEGEDQQRAFLARTSDARSLPSPGRLMPMSDPGGQGDQDGFFYARFQKVGSTDGQAGPGASGPA